MKTMESNKLLFIALIISVCLLSSCNSHSSNEVCNPIPNKISHTMKSPDKKITAIIFEAEEGDNFLSSKRYYLGIKKDNTTYIVTNDLTCGYGIYEGGIQNISWLNNDRIKIEIIISDSYREFIFNVNKQIWEKSNFDK